MLISQPNSNYETVAPFSLATTNSCFSNYKSVITAFHLAGFVYDLNDAFRIGQGLRAINVFLMVQFG